MKTEKKIVAIMTGLLASMQPVCSQTNTGSGKSNGIYFHASDVENNRLSFAFDSAQAGYNLKENAWKSGQIRLSTPDTSFLLNREMYWGYRKGHQTKRVYQGLRYTILAQHGELWIYQPDSFKKTSLYFSRTADGTVFLLNRHLLRKVFADHPWFLTLLALKPRRDLEGTIPPHQELRVMALYKHSLTSGLTGRYSPDNQLSGEDIR